MTPIALNKQPVTLLKTAFNTIIDNPVILFPFCIGAFIQILVLEIIFFAPRYPLSIFFEPLIARFEGPAFLHYPLNFTLLTRWFQASQVWIYVLFSIYLAGCTVAIIHSLNNNKEIEMKAILKKTLSSYVHLFVMAVLSLAVIFGFLNLYGLLIKRALLIRSTFGIYFIIKQVILVGAPYFNFLFAVLITALFAFVVPIIIIEEKKVFSAIVLNFKNLWRSFWFVFIVVLLPSLLYVPVLLLKANRQVFGPFLPPEAWGVVLFVSIFVTLFIEVIQYTAMTTYYLIKREAK